MDAKIITGLLLCVYLMTCISLSQSASDEFDTRLRFRRQEGGTATGATTDAFQAAADNAATAILADGTTIVLPPGTTATVVADTTAFGTIGPNVATGATETIEANAATGATETIEPNAFTGATETIEANAATGATETIEAAASDATTIEAGTGASDDTSAINDATTNAGVTFDLTTVDSNITSLSDNETSTETGSWATTLDAEEVDGNVTRGNDTEEATVPSRVGLHVVVSPDVIQVQRGRTVELTCTVYGADKNTNIYWIQDEPQRRYALTDPAGENDKQVTASQVILRSRITLDDPSKIGKYTCSAQDANQNTGSASVTMQEGGSSGGYYPGGVVPGPAPSAGGRGYLRIIAPIMTEGDYVEINCEGAAPEDEGRIQWYFNEKPVADVQPLFPRGKTLHIRPISRPYLGNYRCTVPGGSYTDANSVLTFAGTSGGSGPVPPVQPTGSCSIDEATCRNGRCIPRAYLCDGKNDCGDNSDEACSQAGGSGTDVCQPNEIRCADGSRGRKCVQKFWMCDGDRDCDDGSDEQQQWCGLLPQQRFCKPSEFQCTNSTGPNGNPVCIPRSFQCDGYNDCPDRSDEIGCAKPAVISPPQRQIEINSGETLRIQCTARGSPAPYINWRLNWGHICGDGSDNGRCTMAQVLDDNDPTLVTGTLTVRNVNSNDGGAYSCEALNNQGFIFAIPDAIVNVLIDGRAPQAQPCNCNGHSTTCSPDGRCLNCQHNTAGYNCEHCAPGFQGDARRGTSQDCQYVPLPSTGNCDPSGTHMERGGRCICKYNVEGDRCDRCKHNHFYLNPTTPNGCLPCFCSGVSSDCRSTDWRRQAVPLSLENWNAVPKNFATDLYEAGNKIQRRQNGRELALDQSSLGRPGNDVLYWKAPKEILGDVVTLYDGNIDIHFTNDGNDKEAPSNDEFIWLRGNNIDLVHKLPQTQRFKANTNATYSVPCNERTFTRKDGTHIDRENILMALSDLDTFLVKINPIGGRKNAVLRGVTLNVAARDGYADGAPTVESCSCPANYTGTSCEKCAEGYGRPHPLVGIYLGQCWACRSLCHERSDQCDRETGKCSNCQGNSEGDRCERCRAGYVLDSRSNQCVREDQYAPYPSQPDGTGSRGSYYIGQRPYDGQSAAPLRIVLDSNQPEQRIPLQILNIQPQSVVWGRTDGQPLPSGVFQENNDLVIRNPSNEQAGNYVCTITHPDGSVERLPIYLEYPGHGQPGGVQPVVGGLPHISIQPKVINLKEGQRMIVQYTVGSHEPIEVVWNKLTDQGYQPIPSLFTVEPNRLVLQRATPDAAGVYQVIVRNSHGEDKQELRINVEPRRRNRGPQVRFPQSQYEIGQGETIDIVPNISGASGATISWSKDGSTSLPHGVTAREDGYLRIEGHSQDVAGQYSLDVTNARGRTSTPLVVSWRGASSQQHGDHGNAGQDQQRSYIQVYFQSRDEQSHQVGRDIHLQCTVHGSVERPYEYTFTKDGRPLENNVEVHPDGLLIIRNAQAHDAGRYRCEVNFPRAPEAGRQESSYDLRLDGASAGGYEQNYQHGGDQGQQGGYEQNYQHGGDQGQQGGYEQNYQHGGDHGQQGEYIEVTVEPSEVAIERGQRATITCRVKGTDQYKVTWGLYAHDTSLPSYARQEGNDVIITPTADIPDIQNYFQCQVDVPGQAPRHAYAPVNIRGGEQTSKKKKKRRT